MSKGKPSWDQKDKSVKAGMQSGNKGSEVKPKSPKGK
jgi:hypothetical protein